MEQPAAASPAPYGADALGPELDALLVTRLVVPQPRPDALRRAGLLAQLDAALAAPLTVVIAPAGYGKTSLLIDWLGARRQRARPGRPAPRVAWVSLDGADDEPAAFLRAVIGALRLAGAPVGGQTLALLRGPTPPPLAVASVPLLNELAALPGDTLLVLDDYHALAEPAVHALLAFAVERLPPRVHVVVASRSDPPLPLPRLRARGLLVELRTPQLRLAPDEARALLQPYLRSPLAPDDLARLIERTDGWAAALHLAGLALRGQPAPAQVVAGFSGSQQTLFDYLVGEVLDTQPPQRRHFLLHTAALSRLSGPLCDALLGLAPGQGAARLRELERAGLFVQPLDGHGGWYRYHQLFAEALREQLRRTLPPAQLAELYRRAAAIEPAPLAAIEYLLTAGLWQDAAERIETIAPPMLAQGHHRTVRRWIDTLPAELRDARPGLCVLRGTIASRHGEPAYAQQLLTRALAHGPAPASSAWPALALAELALLALQRGELARCAGLVDEALALPAPPAARVSTLLLAVFVRSVLGRREQVAQAAAALFALLGSRPEPLLRALALEGALSLALALFDQLGPLEELCREGLAEGGEELSLARIGAEGGLAHSAWLRGRIDEALALSARARLSGERLGGLAAIEPQLASIAGIVAMARGDLAGAARCYEQALRSAEPQALYDFARPGRRYRLALVHWQQGRLGELRAARAAVAADTPSSPLHGAVAGLLGALVALSEGQDAEAEALLGPLVRAEAEAGLLAVFGSAHPLLAHLERRRGRSAEAAAALAPLLGACARAGTPGRLLMEGPYIAPLLQLAVAHGVYAEFAAKTLARLEAPGSEDAAGAAPVARAGAPAGQRLAEPLSARELEVLELLAAGHSNRAIAERLVVTVGTVKRHVSNLMGKLGAESRLAAVARARQLGLVGERPAEGPQRGSAVGSTPNATKVQ